jgi:predicted pyridoxine 5'-phosphate oxidase superfamily flavin-nucleotide-binding protein
MTQESQEYRNFHRGEAAIQAESGVDTAEFDRAVDQPFRPELNSSEVTFVNGRTFSVAASIDGNGQPWASPLIGNAGELLSVADLTTVKVRPRPIPGDPLVDNLQATGSMGILYFNPAIRRRAKSLGNGEVEPDGAITYRMHRMFGLCPKYIFKRSHDVGVPTGPLPPDAPVVATVLSVEDQAQLGEADTIFLASRSERFGVDPTHRGGPAGFVSVVDDTTLSIPDYLGNGMFQTFGNLKLDDRIGVLSIDFQTGRVLQITGHGSIRAAGSQTEPIDPRARTLTISVDEVRSAYADIGTWTDIEAFDMPASA